jgi:hypothetical protein
MKTQERRSVEQKSIGEMNGSVAVPRHGSLRRIGAKAPPILLLAVALAALLTWPNVAMAEEPDEGYAATVYTDITYDINVGQPSIAEELSQDGLVYRIRSVSEPVPAEGAVHWRGYMASIEGEVTVYTYEAGMDAIRSAFPQSLPIDEDGFKGSISLDSVSTSPTYITYQRPVEREMVIDGLANADIADLPTSHVFTVSSEEYIGATCDTELQRLSVTTQVTSYDADGRPESYGATLVFRGIERCMAIDSYHAIALYSGDVPARVMLVTVTVAYDLVPPAVAASQPADQSARQLGDPETSVRQALEPESREDQAFEWPLALAGALAVIILSLVPVIYLRLWADARLVSVNPYGRERLLLARRLRIGQGLAVFTLPGDFDLGRLDASCHLLLRGKRHTKADWLEIQRSNQVIYRGKPQGRMNVGRFIVIGATEALFAADEATQDAA